MKNSKSSFQIKYFVTKTVAKIVEDGAVSALPSGVLPLVINPLEAVPKLNFDKFRPIVNIRYANENLVKKAFRFEGLLSDISDMAETVLMWTIPSLTISHRVITTCRFTPIHDALWDLIGEEFITNIVAFPLVYQLPPLGCFQNLFAN
jgi:hypothetical protein